MQNTQVPPADGGSIPAPSLQDLWIRPCTSMGDIREFVETHHYSHSIQGITPFLCFEIVLRENFQRQVGAAIFGIPGQVQTERKYGEYLDSKQKSRPGIVAVELRRFVLLEELPKNSESWILGKILKMLGCLGVERIISYADPNQRREDHPDKKHTGLIYRASGFKKEKEGGRTKAVIMLDDFEVNGKTFHKGRRLPIRNLDQYRNYRVWNKDELPLPVRLDWEKALRDKKAVVWQERATGKLVFVIKTPAYLTSLSLRLRAAIAAGKAELKKEDGKILYIKDLESPDFLPCELSFSIEEENIDYGNATDRSFSQKTPGVAQRKTQKNSKK